MSVEEVSEQFRIEEFHPFLFRDGTIQSPVQLRDTPEQNYLSPALKALGYTLMGILLFLCLALFIWVLVNRKHRVVAAANPPLLGRMIVGAALSSVTIFFITTDEQSGFSSEQLGRQCMAMVWCFSIGHILTYSALFTKVRTVVLELTFASLISISDTVSLWCT